MENTAQPEIQPNLQPIILTTQKSADSLPKLDKNSMKIFLLIFVILTVMFATATLILVLGKNPEKKNTNTPDALTNAINISAVSGTLNFNGYTPTGATVAISERKAGESQFNVVVSGLAANDGGVWSWNGAQKGVAYELKAVLQKDGQTLVDGDSLTVVAPADSEILTINSKITPPKPVPTTISGTFDLNGYLPTGSTLTVSTRKVGDSQFNPVVSGIAAKDGIIWSWNNAVAGTSYEIQGYLIYSGNVIAQSKTQIITAPAYNEIIRINSPATGGPTITSISGTINHNGIIPANSTYSIAQRQNGTAQQFAVVVSGIPVSDSAAWIWNQARSGIIYDLQAYLINNGNIIATSQVLTAAAPAVNEILTINGQTQPPAPPANSLTDACLGQDGSGKWQVKITYNNNTIIKNAQQYWFTIGTSSQDSSIVNSQTTPSNPNQSQTYTTNYVFNTNTTYYAQWAYSTCTSCSTFSPFSPSLQFSCSPQPTNSPTPVPSNTPIPTSTPTPTPTLTPTLIPPTDTPTPTDPDPSPPTNTP